MFLLDDDRLVISASDLRIAATCEFALVAELDVRLGRRERVTVEDDPILARVKELGDQHEQAELRRLSRAHPGAVVQLARPAYTDAGLREAMQHTLRTLRSEAEVLFQATFFDGGFVGHADFIERTPQGWLVSDTKLARSASVPALLQIAAYAAMLRSCGVPTAPVARLVLGDGDARDHALSDILPVYRSRRARLDAVLADHRADDEPARWGDERWLACGRCEACEPEVEAARDLLLVAGMRAPTRRRFLEAGVSTVEDLAVRTAPVPDVREGTQERLREQARLQLVQDRDGEVVAEVVDEMTLRRLPAPSPGDIFFDFEGDPLWAEPGSSVWGLEYLFGIVEVDGGGPAFRTFWAHDRAQERQALIDFVGYLAGRRARWPALHVYHYAPYEPSALLRLAARHGVCEDDVDQLLRDGVFVDLYATVRAGIRVSQRSYSIKKLEPLYMPAREAAVTNAADSIVVYHQVVAARVEGRVDRAAELLQEIADYNLDDCVSTLRLRDWLLSRLPDDRRGLPYEVPDAAPAVLSDQRVALMRLEALVRARIEGVKPHERSDEQQALALVAASVLFHAREDKPIWQAHFERLRTPTSQWRGGDGVFLVESAQVKEPWHQLTPRQRPRRTLLLSGEPMRGVPLGISSEVNAVYPEPAPQGIVALPGHANARSSASVKVLEAHDSLSANGRLHQQLFVEELQPKGGAAHDDPPIALVPSGMVNTKPIDDALAEVARRVVDSPDGLPRSAGIDLLLRRPARLRGSAPLMAVGSGDERHIDAITGSLLALEDSYVAVQGPPGTGKTYVGSRVIARLVLEHGWRVGVTSQGHKAVENVLRAVVAAGVPASQVAKATKDTTDPPWTSLKHADELAAFSGSHREHGRGYVIGGTAWDLTNARRVGRDELDLVVVDEAGQFSLAKTLACAVAGSRLLLLGDPQQLPQVSTGIHPDPVGTSALGWLIGEEPVLPSTLGYFLETTWRMHPALTAPVSVLAYAGRLTSEEAVTTARSLQGVDPGVHLRLVDHHDNSTWSPEEGEEVLSIVRDLIGRTWRDGSTSGRDAGPGSDRPLEASDILVITPYNAQVGLLRRVLADAGLDDVPVGTVDKFQGQEAPVVIVSMAASSPSDVSRGMSFLLDRHRLNVAISRGQVAAFLVRSRVLTDFSPRTPKELIALGAFLGLCDCAVSEVGAPT